MDFEKAYKEARERATKVIIRCRPLSTEANLAVHYALSYVFPATTETEDERIRKRLVEYFNGFYDRFSSRNNVNVHWEGLDVKAVIAWLEKQKEQQPAEWSEEDEEKLDFVLSVCKERPSVCVEGSVFHNKLNEAQKWIKSLRHQHLWKPSEGQMKILQYLCEHSSHANPDVIPTLESLYADLQKLL